MAQRHTMSICIASYGDSVGALLAELKLCEDFGLPEGWDIEVLISDQHPERHPEADRWMEVYKCNYYQATTQGRSANRNGLAKEATGAFLLFLDADALPKTAGFLNRYCNYALQSTVLVGGTAYRPGYKADSLRVRVGKVKEEKSPMDREKNPYGSFSAFNFLIRRETFLEIGFSETVTTYGHEDTLFGLALKHLNIDIMHIDNPAYHMGIDEGPDFMTKTDAAVDGLAQLIISGKIDEDIALFAALRWVRRLQLRPLFRVLYALFGKALKRGLSKNKLPLFCFDLYKLLRLSTHTIEIGRRMP